MEIKRRSRWHEFYNDTEANVIAMLEEKIWNSKTTGREVALNAGLHSGFWSKFTTGQTSPSRKSLFCFCRSLGLPVENICALYRKGYKPTHREIAKWENQGGGKIQKQLLAPKQFDQSELSIFDDLDDVKTPEAYDLHCIRWLKSRGFKIQKTVTVTTLEEV